MKELRHFINLINVNKKHKINCSTTVVNKTTVCLLKLLLKINIILFFKKIKKNLFFIKLNSTTSLKLKIFLKKKKLILKKNNNKDVFVITNSGGLFISNNKNKKYGFILCKIQYFYHTVSIQ